MITIGYHLSHSHDYGHAGIVAGILDYAIQQGWRCEKHAPEFLVTKAKQQKIHGAIAHVTVEAEVMLADLKVPLVNISGRPDPQQWPTVCSDDQLVGRLAAQHFLDRGHRRFAFASIPEHRYSQNRLQAFRAALASRGHEVVELYQQLDKQGEPESILTWAARSVDILRRLGRPVAVFACNDERALHLSRALNDAGIQQPEDISILGVDNDPITCRLANPPLSSVKIDAARIGYEAAARLDRMRLGHESHLDPILVPPLGIEERLSTNAFAVSDERLAQALQWIRQNVHQGINVRDVLRTHGVSRRWLEVACHKHLGRSPLEEIHRARLALAKKLLIDTDLPISDVANRSGYSDAKVMAMTFRKHLEQPPSAIRREHRRKDLRE